MLNQETLKKIQEIIKFVDGINFPETKSGRKYAKISKEEFVEKLKIGVSIQHQTNLDRCFMFHKYKGKCSEDLKKINFDSENADTELMEHDDLVYLKCRVGGDWEYPITCFLYFDGNDIRGYVPEKGNTFNLFTRTAFGSEPDADSTSTKTSQLVEEMFSDKEEDFKVNLLQMLSLYKMNQPNIFNNLEEMDEDILFDYINPPEMLDEYCNQDLMLNDFLKRLGKI